MKQDTQIDPFNFMLSNFETAAKDMPDDFRSLNWDAFPNGYSDIIKNQKIWPRMLRNALTIGFNDALHSLSNQRFTSGDLDMWKKMKEGDFPDLIKEEIGEGFNKTVINKVKKLIHATDMDYVLNNNLGAIGNPVIYELNIKRENSPVNKLRYNTHDHDDIYHSWFIVNHLKHLENDRPVICEIGSGYGGLVAKIKNNIKKSKIIIFDLPEVNAVHSYYLINLFPDNKFLGYQEFLKYGASLLDAEFDFLILPGWIANDLLQKRKVDAFINVRSMMEMNNAVVHKYFEIIQTSLKQNGLFACINRYTKMVINKSKDNELNRMAEYPFDDYWSPLYSFPSEIQPHIHVLLAKREKNKPQYSFKETLKAIRPNLYLQR